jgi:serine/threonine-protein kinase
VLEIGSIIDGKYKVLNKIGQGGMSVVYLAMNERANKQWAIKEVRKDGTGVDETVRQSLVAETEILKKLHHQNLPSIIDVIETQDTLLLVMDYIEGNPLSQALSAYGALNQDDVVKWSKQLCGVLGYLHSRQPAIIYRDMKPSNIMLRPNGDITVIDFGTAREFKEGRVDDTRPLGTEGYAAPEQFGDHQTDARTDIYTLGATMYHLISGHNPCEPPYVMHPIRYWNPQLSSGLEQIITKCIQRDPDDRYQSASALLYDLEHYHELDIEYRRTQTKKWRAFLAAAICTVVFVLGSIGFAFAEATQMQNSYSVLIARAEALGGSGSLAEIAHYYTQAATFDPTREQAYNQFLRIIKADQNIGENEDQLLRRMLNENSGTSTTNSERFRAANPAAYAAFAYDLGIAYYFAYNGAGDKSKAENWLKAAAASTTLSSQKTALAQRLAFIAENYDAFLKGGNNSSGVSGLLSSDVFSPRTYWDELVSLSDGDLVEITGNTFISLGVYKELVYQTYEHAKLFADAGVSESEMLAQLSKAVEGLSALRTIDAEEQAAIAETQALITSAEQVVKTTVANSSGASQRTATTASGS